MPLMFVRCFTLNMFMSDGGIDVVEEEAALCPCGVMGAPIDQRMGAKVEKYLGGGVSVLTVFLATPPLDKWT